MAKTKYKTEVLSGLTVALALVPEAIAFAMIAGFSPLTGLYAAFAMGLVTSLFGGKPGMISGATGAVAVIFVGLILQLRESSPNITNEEILQYVFATVILAGALQILAGVLKLGKFIRLVPHSVMYGFVNGLAIIIFMAQLPTITGIVEQNPGIGLYFASFLGNSEAPGMASVTPGLLQLAVMLGLVVLTMLIIWRLPRLTKAVPSSLAAILIVSAVVIFFDIPTTTVKDTLLPGESINGGFPPFGLPRITWGWDSLALIFPYSAIVAGVGLIESLLTLNLIEEITETRGNSNQECIAQGAANIASGFFSGMGGCAMIGQSIINTSAGARARLSGVVAACMLLVFIMFGSGIIEKLPMAALVGLMFMVAIGTFEWASFRTLRTMPTLDVIVMALVTIITVVTHNLAIAVLTGVVLSALAFSWENAVRIRAEISVDELGVKHYEIVGPLFFASVKAFSEKFDVANDPEEVIIDFRNSRVVDMSAIEALNAVTARYRKVGKRVRLRSLSGDCKILLQNADAIIDVNIMRDPSYRVVTNNVKPLLEK